MIFDLDDPTPGQREPTGRRLPWVLFAAAFAGLVLALVPRLAIAPVRPALPQSQTTISERTSPGDDLHAQVFRDQDGQIIAVLDLVLPVGDDNAWCVLSVNGEVVTQNMGDGKPAICIWIRGAVPPLPPG